MEKSFFTLGLLVASMVTIIAPTKSLADAESDAQAIAQAIRIAKSPLIAANALKAHYAKTEKTLDKNLRARNLKYSDADRLFCFASPPFSILNGTSNHEFPKMDRSGLFYDKNGNETHRASFNAHKASRYKNSNSPRCNKFKLSTYGRVAGFQKVYEESVSPVEFESQYSADLPFTFENFLMDKVKADYSKIVNQEHGKALRALAKMVSDKESSTFANCAVNAIYKFSNDQSDLVGDTASKATATYEKMLTILAVKIKDEQTLTGGRSDVCRAFDLDLRIDELETRMDVIESNIQSLQIRMSGIDQELKEMKTNQMIENAKFWMFATGGFLLSNASNIFR